MGESRAEEATVEVTAGVAKAVAAQERGRAGRVEALEDKGCLADWGVTVVAARAAAATGEATAEVATAVEAREVAAMAAVAEVAATAMVATVAAATASGASAHHQGSTHRPCTRCM